MGAFKTLDHVDVAGKACLVRVDLNVPMEGGVVTDDTRIRAVAPTIVELSDKGAKVILLAHFGRPKDGPEAKYSLKQIVPDVAKVIGRPVAFATDCVGEVAKAAIAELANGDVILLENTRFHKAEEKNDPVFVQELAALGEIFVNDAFATAHRAHASTEGLAHKLPAYAGRCMQREIEALEAALGSPKRPVLAVVGGAKVSSKIDLLENLVAKVDMLVIGGGMANTFLAAQGIAVGKSLCEHDLADTARRILEKAKAVGCEMILPVDAVVAAEFKAGADNVIVEVKDVPAGGMILDVGPASVNLVADAIDRASTVVWNGPLGAFEIAPFDRATVAAAKHAAARTKSAGLLSVAGGGDTVAALNHAGVGDDFSYVSTAGGAFLEWLEGKPLPGVEVLRT